MIAPPRNVVFFRACGIALVCLVVFAVSYPLLSKIIN